MTLGSTEHGELRIDIEDVSDWVLLGGITSDATSCKDKLSHRLGDFITDEEVAMDWLEFTVPELEQGFNEALLHVTTAIARSRVEAKDGRGCLIVGRDDLFHWYSSLNQARHALEEIYHFGPGESVNADALPEHLRTPFLRSQFYSAIQNLLLDIGM